MVVFAFWAIVEVTCTFFSSIVSAQKQLCEIIYVAARIVEDDK